MYQRIKRFFYFFVAWYFRIFAEVRLRFWHPRVIVITGSNGKTTLLHLVESQLGSHAKYSHHANSSIGIPFDILGLKGKTLTFDEWPMLFLMAPFKLFTPTPKENIYVVEADCDRPYEGKFLGSLLKPEVTLWLSSSKTHSMNFEDLLSGKGFTKIEEAIAHEFGYFAENTSKLLIINADNEFILKESSRTKANIDKVSLSRSLKKYDISRMGTNFNFSGIKISFKYLLPREVGSSILMCRKLCECLEVAFDPTFDNLHLPPGRNSLFKGIKNLTIVDSTYNANLDSMRAILNMFSELPGKPKWVVLGDMLEQGSQEKGEHEKLAQEINKHKFQKIIFLGPRISKYTKPLIKNEVVSFDNPKEILEFLKKNIVGGEIILFKGARFLDGVVENLLLDKTDAAKLARREKIWEIRRRKWGL